MGVRFYLQTIDYMNVSQPQYSEDSEMLHVFIGMHVKMLSDSFLYGNMPIVLTVGGVKGTMSRGRLYFQSTNISENKFKSEDVSKFVKETY